VSQGQHVTTDGPRLIRIENRQDIAEGLCANGIAVGSRVLVCVGGASGLGEEHAAALTGAFHDLVAPAVDAWSAVVVDGGTDAGVMRMIGRARASAGAGFPLIGVAAIGTVRLPDAPASDEDATPLEPNHTHVVLVPGTKWGDETPWLAAVAGVIAGDRPSVTVVVNGGTITLSDAEASLAAGRPVIVLAGSGRTADDIARARAGEQAGERARAIAASPLTSIVDAGDPRGIVEGIAAALAGDRRQ